MTREEFLRKLKPEIDNISQGYPEAQDFLEYCANSNGAALFTATRHIIPTLMEKNVGGKELAFFWVMAEKDIMIMGKLVAILDAPTIRLMSLLPNYDVIAGHFKEVVIDLKQRAKDAGVYREDKADYQTEKGWN